MARVTVEDCIDKVDNRFDLVLLAAHRARMISSGSQLTVDRDNDKNPVVSLREIAARKVDQKMIDEIDKQTLLSMCQEAYATFSHRAVTPLTQLEPGMFLLELCLNVQRSPSRLAIVRARRDGQRGRADLSVSRMAISPRWFAGTCAGCR